MARKSRRTRRLRVVNPDCAGIDIGKDRHFVAVEAERSDEPVRSFGSFTRDLEAMAAWLASCGVTKVGMESTSVYWIPVYETLERAGFEVDDLWLIASVRDAARQRFGAAQSALRLAQQDKPAVRGDLAGVEGGAHLLARDGWQINGKKAIVGHGGRGLFVARKESRFNNEFLPNANGLRHVRHP